MELTVLMQFCLLNIYQLTRVHALLKVKSVSFCLTDTALRYATRPGIIQYLDAASCPYVRAIRAT